MTGEEQQIRAMKMAMQDARLTAVDVSRLLGRDDAGNYVRQALVPGRSQKARLHVADFLRKHLNLPSGWPELVEVGPLPVGFVPHAGTVGAGAGQYVDADFEPVEVPASWITPDTRGMTVSGDSMYPFLWDGDHVLCRLADRPIPGKVMVARTPDGIVIKLVAHGKNGFELHSLADGYEPIKARDAFIIGILIGRYRVYPKPKQRVDLSFDADGLMPDPA